MIHLTLNNGHSMEIPKGKIHKESIRILGQMVAKGGDIIPHFSPWRTVIGRSPGCASFDIRRGKNMLVVFNVVAWTIEGAASAWDALERQYMLSAEQHAAKGIVFDLAMPEIPASLPWLVTWILPSAIQNVNPNELRWMADFEQCLAATIIYKSTGILPS